MLNKNYHDAELLHRLVSRIAPDVPSEDFTSRIMERVTATPDPVQLKATRLQWILFLGSAAIAITMVFFPVWSWLGFEFTPWEFVSYYLLQYLHLGAQWLGKNMSFLAHMGFLSYLIPVSVAIILLGAFDQALLHRRLQSSAS